MIRYILISYLLFFTSSISFSQNMSHWVEVGLKNSPTKSAQLAKIKAAEQAVETAYEWADTHVEFSAIEWMPNSISPYYRPTVSVSQELPWFGTKKTKKKIASAGIATQLAETELVLADLSLQIKSQYIELQFLESKIKLLEKQAEDLAILYENLIVKLEAGLASAWEVILLENEINQVNSNILKATNQVRLQKQIFMLLVGSPIADLELDALEMHTTSQQISLGKHPSLMRLEAEKEELEAAINQLTLDYAPKLSVGIHYEAAMPVEPTYLTHDMLMPSIGVSIPIWTNKKKSKQKLVNLQQQVLNEQIQLEVTKLNQEILASKEELFNLELDWKTQATNIANIQDAKQLLWREYEANKVNFQEVTRLETRVIESELEQLETNKLYNQKQVYLTYLLTESL